LWDAAPCLANAVHYADIIRGLAHKRRLLNALNTARESILDPSLSSDQAQEAVEREVLRVSEVGDKGQTTGMPEAIKASVEHLNRKIEVRKSGGKLGVPTGFSDLDRVLGGMQPNELCFVAARPSVGKTAFAGNIVANIAHLRIPVLFVSLEQSKEELIARHWCKFAEVDSRAMREGDLRPVDLQAILEACNDMDRWPIEWADQPGQTMVRIAANARRLKRQNKLGLLVIDYLQLIEPDDERRPRHEQVAATSRRLKMLARELKAPVVVLAQVNREADKRVGGKPRLSDLRESGAVEQDADTVLLLYREGDDDDLPSGRETDTIMVNVAKQRNGPTDEIRLTYRRRFLSFEDYAP
jgi:replicative DNA helicase